MNITSEEKNSLTNCYNTDQLPIQHFNYLYDLKRNFNVEPKVIYDIGSCCLHWTRKIADIWPESFYYCFEAMDTAEFLYDVPKIFPFSSNERPINFEYNIGVLSDADDKDLIFYQSTVSPGGNSYYKENSWATPIYYGKDSERGVKATTLDTVVEKRGFKFPDLIKLDVQGCEIDILRGAHKVLKKCEHIIVELQHSQYNIGAPLNTESIPIIESFGFKLITPLFTNNGPDGDYHFQKINK